MEDNSLAVMRRQLKAEIEEFRNDIREIQHKIDVREKMLAQMQLPISESIIPPPNLDDIPIADAIQKYLDWERSNGRRVTLGELRQALERYSVRTSRGGTYAANANRWKLLTNVLVAPDNAKHWTIERQMEKRLTPGDVISLVEEIRELAAD